MTATAACSERLQQPLSRSRRARPTPIPRDVNEGLGKRRGGRGFARRGGGLQLIRLLPSMTPQRQWKLLAVLAPRAKLSMGYVRDIATRSTGR